jgi:hypothetical protein
MADTPTDGIIWFPGEPKGRDAAGNIIDSPSSPTVDADENLDDQGQMEEVVDQQEENLETGDAQEPEPVESTEETKEEETTTEEEPQ